MSASCISASQVEACLRNLKLLVEEVDGLGTSFDFNDHASYLAEFLAVCAHSLNAESGPARERYSDELYQTRDVFVRAGLEALATRSWQTGNEWLQFGVRPREHLEPRAELCRQVASLARRLLGGSAADNFFFMNKPPGMRLRFQKGAGSPADLEEVLQGQIKHWCAEGLIDYVESVVYEPESQLFGGSRSMSFVHALFTVDSLIWLDYHACRAVEGEAISPAWLLSLAMLRTIFVGLNITGWEDIGVWDCIRAIAGRRLGGDKVSFPTYAAVAGEIREVWSRRDNIVDRLHPAVKEMVSRNDSALLRGAAQWRYGYFCQRGASLGPRAAAALYVIFHWNRAALSRTEQALLAESLSQRILEDVHR